MNWSEHSNHVLAGAMEIAMTPKKPVLEWVLSDGDGDENAFSSTHRYCVEFDAENPFPEAVVLNRATKEVFSLGFFPTREEAKAAVERHWSNTFRRTNDNAH